MLACLTSGWTCPGYSTPWKFVDETHQLVKHYASRKCVYDIIDRELEAAHRRDQCSDLELWFPLSYPLQNDLGTMFTDIYIPRSLGPNPLGSCVLYRQ
jgi:hypothetical protein